MDLDGIEFALRSVICNLDYDLHKGIECGEEDEINRYPEVVEHFIEEYLRFMSK